MVRSLGYETPGCTDYAGLLIKMSKTTNLLLSLDLLALAALLLLGLLRRQKGIIGSKIA